MIKQYFPLKSIFPLTLVLLFVFVNKAYPEYSTKFLYLYLPLIAAFVIYDLIKKKKEDKINGTTQVKESVFRILIGGGLLLVFFFLTGFQSPQL